MLSMNNVGSAAQALHYFSQDNYYTQDEGLENSAWFGSGAEALGLEGQVDKEKFFQLLAGQVDGQEIGKYVRNEKTGVREREHRPGFDITFSAPKSVSLMAQVHGAADVRAAHEAAVQKALRYVESDLAATRQTDGGRTDTVKTGNLAVAMFRHSTSRDLDPQTHTHALIMNATQREDGQWRSLTNEEIYKSQRLIGAIYTSELAAQLQSLGYDLRRVDDKGNFEIQGISREQIEHFSQRRAGIEAALKAKGLELDGASAQQKEDATLKTRARKVDVDHAVLLRDWKQRAQDIGIDFGAIQSKADAQREAGGAVRPDRLTGRDAVAFATAHLVEREAVIDRQEVLRVAIEHGAGRVSATDVQAAFAQLEAKGDLVRLPDGMYTTRKMLGSESWTVEQVQAQKGQTPSMMPTDAAAKRIEAAEQSQGFAFSAGQREALSTVMTSADRFVAVQGLAGTGKTTMLKALRGMAEEQGYTVRGMAPTGAASKVIAQETGINAETVAMFLLKERQLQKDIALAQQYLPEFQRKAELWVADEGSFLSQRNKAQLDHLAIKAGAKVVYLGDSLQLQGVEAGKPFEMAQRNGIQTAYMTEINRQKTPELKAAVDILTGRDMLAPGERLTNVELAHNTRAFKFMQEQGMVREVKGSGGELVGAVVDNVLKLGPQERERTIVITAYNKDRAAINEGVREGLKQEGALGPKDYTREVLVGKGWTRPVLKEAQYYQAGDVVRFGRDYQQIDAKKGEYARVTSVEAQRGVVVLRKDDGTTLEWEPSRHNKVEVYDAETRQIAQGDLIRITRNDSGFKNGEVARVTALTDTHATLEIRQGANTTVHQVDVTRNRHWDHAYARTVHSSQGATEHRAIFHIRTPESASEFKQAKELEAMAKVFGDRSFYVGATRASHSLQIYTNNVDAAAMAVAGKQNKSSALETIQQAGMVDPSPSRSAGVAR